MLSQLKVASRDLEDTVKRVSGRKVQALVGCRALQVPGKQVRNTRSRLAALADVSDGLRLANHQISSALIYVQMSSLDAYRAPYQNKAL